MSDTWCVPGNHSAARVPAKTRTSRMYMYVSNVTTGARIISNQPKIKKKIRSYRVDYLLITKLGLIYFIYVNVTKIIILISLVTRSRPIPS